MPDNKTSFIRRRRIVSGLALLGVQSLLPACADPSAGRALFEQQCQQCHRAGPNTLRTPAADIPALLKSGSIRPHRFQLSGTQLGDLKAYLTGIKANMR